MLLDRISMSTVNLLDKVQLAIPFSTSSKDQLTHSLITLIEININKSIKMYQSTSRSILNFMEAILTYWLSINNKEEI